MKDRITEIIKKSSIALLIELTMILMITTLLFILNITITKLHLPIITIIAVIGFLVFYRKDDKKINLIAILVAFVIFAGITFGEGKIYDSTADGNTYHKLAVGCLKNGWNPNYEDSQDFTREKGNIFDPSEENVNTKWVDHYAKATEIFGAVIYAFTNNIESGKGYTLILMYSAFGILFSYLYHDKKRNLFTSLIIPFLLVFNAITVVQIFNYYVDGALMISILLIIYSLIVESENNSTDNKENLLILAINIIWCINIKFTGIGFAGIFCLVFYIYWLIKAFKENSENGIKILKKYTIFYIIVVIISIAIVGYSSYVRNTIDHGHPLYPLKGEGHVDNMVLMEQPTSFKDKNHLEIFLISIFSKGENVSPSYSNQNIQPTLKIPFTVSMDEIENYCIPDIRVGGYGPLFSIIFIASIIGTIYIIVKLIKQKRWNLFVPYILIISTITGLILALDGNYWARYIPYFYAIPMMVLIDLLWDKENKIKFLLGIILSIIMLINVNMVLYTTVKSTKISNSYIKNVLGNFIEYYNENKENEISIKLNHMGLQGVLYNLNDLGIDKYELNQNIEGKNDGYFFKYN